MKIFALHDADPAGYNIGRTLGEATERMPHHSVDVIDLGLTVDTAIGLGLEPEEFIRDRALASTILPKLSDVALEWTRSSPPRMSSLLKMCRPTCAVNIHLVVPAGRFL